MKFLYDAFISVKDDPKQAVRTLREYNADFARAYVLFSAANFVNQQAAEYGYGVMPGVTNAASSMLWNAAFWGNDLVLSTIERFLPDAVKDKVDLGGDKTEQEQEQLEADTAKPKAL